MNNRAGITQVAIYARLSVTKDESVSIARQLESARSYAEARGWQVVLEAVDDGVSASKIKPEDREGWRTVLSAPETFQGVIVWKIDRLARRVMDFLTADEALQARGAGIVAVADPIDMTTPQGRAFATILAVFGEMEAGAMSARQTAARRQLVKDGRRAGGRPPFGYRNIKNPDGPGMILAHDPETIGYVKEMARKVMRKDSIYSVARWLEAEGVKPRARANRKNDWEWVPDSVEVILTNPILAGMVRYNTGRKPGPTPTYLDVLRDARGMPVVDESLAIMSQQEWRDLVATIETGKAPGSRPRKTDKPNLLLGLVKCGGCGGPLHRTGKEAGKYVYLRCVNLKCTRKATVPEGPTIDYVVDAVLDRTSTFTLIGQAPQGEVDATLADIQAAIDDTTSQLGEVDDPELEARLTERLALLKENRRAARAAQQHSPKPEPDRASFPDLLRGDDLLAKRDVLTAVLDHVEVHPALEKNRRFDSEKAAERFTLVWHPEIEPHV